MNHEQEKTSEVIDGNLAPLQWILLHAEVAGITGVLLGAYYVQFAMQEFPCPLCILQRMAMMLAAVGPAYMLGSIHSSRSHDHNVLTVAYGTSILGAVLGLFISSRQVLLHILPGDDGYGSAVMGMHLYTWAIVVFVVVVAVCGLTLVFTPRLQMAKRSGRMPIPTKIVLSAFILVIFLNVVTTFVESGFNLYLPDSPTSYKLIDGIKDVGGTEGNPS